VKRAASSGPGSWFFARSLHHFDRWFLRLSGGRVTLTSLLTGAPVVFVTTQGARSKLSRTVPLLCIRDEHSTESFALVASNWGQHRNPGWYHNLKANPRATCSIHGEAGEYIAREAVGEEYEAFWKRATEIYLGYPRYKERAAGRRIPIMVMERENARQQASNPELDQSL